MPKCSMIGEQLAGAKELPVRRAPELADREALREAGRRLEAWMAEHKASEEELVEDFERSRKKGRSGR